MTILMYGKGVGFKQMWSDVAGPMLGLKNELRDSVKRSIVMARADNGGNTK